VPAVLQSVVLRLREMSVDWDTNSHLSHGPLPWPASPSASISATQPRGRLVFDEDVVLAMAGETDEASGQSAVRRDALGLCMERSRLDQRRFPNAHHTAGQGLRGRA
jgi:hypothetical protein